MQRVSLLFRLLSFSWILFYFLAVILGAPFFSDIVETSVLAATLTTISILPIAIISDSECRIIELLTFTAEDLTITELRLSSIAAASVICSTFCSVVYPLDWDRWWQRYPLPNLFGAVFGIFVGLFYTLFRDYIERIFPKSKKW